MFKQTKAILLVLISFGTFFLCSHLYARPLTSQTEDTVFMKIRRIGYSMKISEEINEALKKKIPFFVPTDPLPSEKNLTFYGSLTSVILLGPQKKYRCAIYTSLNRTTLVYSRAPTHPPNRSHINILVL